MNTGFPSDHNNDIQRRQLQMMRLQTIMTAAILVIALIVGVFVIVQFSSMKSCIDTITQKAQTIDSETLNEAIDSLREVAENLSGVDTEKLNEFISALNSTAEKFQGTIGAITGFFPFGN